jgi:hypothetical protein
MAPGWVLGVTCLSGMSSVFATCWQHEQCGVRTTFMQVGEAQQDAARSSATVARGIPAAERVLMASTSRMAMRVSGFTHLPGSPMVAASQMSR